MDFGKVLSLASEKQGGSSLQKRYSLQPGPPKKDPKVKGVNSAAVQAFLKKKEVEQKKMELEKKKQKECLLARRVELKSDRKARAMASRTKDNFKGYNGIPVVELPKKKRSKEEMAADMQEFGDDYDDEDNYEYAASNSESEPEPEPEPVPVPVRPQARSNVSSNMSSSHKKPIAQTKAAPSPLNFADLLKLAEKKQFEPVDLKPVAKKTEERLRTADEIRELEMERKVKKQVKGRDSKGDKTSGQKDSKSTSNSHKKQVSERDSRDGKSHKFSSEKPHSGMSKMPKHPAPSERPHSSTKTFPGNGSKTGSSSSGALSGKTAMKSFPPVSVKQAAPRPQSGHKPNTSSDLTSKKVHPGLPHEKSSSSGNPSRSNLNPSRMPGQGPGIKGPGGQGQLRPGQSISSKGGPPPKPRNGEVMRSGANPNPRPNSNGTIRGGSSKQAGIQQPRPGGSLHGHPVPGGGKPSANGPVRPVGSVPARPLNSMGPGRGRPQCTVVSETISSKNFAPRPGMAPRPPAPQGPKTIIGPTGHRILVRPPGPDLPPITSSYKRKYEDEEDEYDPEMEDFIDDEGEEQDEISKHIREIFGYDRTKYKDESDYALKFMESSWKEQQKEEARSLRCAVLEDEEEERRELEDTKRKQAKRRKLTCLRLGIKEDEEEMRLEEEEMKRQQAMKAKRRKT